MRSDAQAIAKKYGLDNVLAFSLGSDGTDGPTCTNVNAAAVVLIEG